MSIIIYMSQTIPKLSRQQLAALDKEWLEMLTTRTGVQYARIMTAQEREHLLALNPDIGK